MENEFTLIDRALNLDGFVEEIWSVYLERNKKFLYSWVRRLPPSILLMSEGEEESRKIFKQFGIYVNEELPTPNLVSRLIFKKNRHTPTSIFKSYTLQEKNEVCEFFLKAGILQMWVK